MAEPFSVLLPVYAGDVPSFFTRAVRSATVEQTMRPAELVVVRDGPVGAALERVLEELEAGPPVSPAGEVPVRLVTLERNVGLAEALDEGLRACSHEIVARADADDVSLPDRFAVEIPLVADGLDLLGSAITEFVDDGELGLTRVLPTDPAEILRTARFRDPFNHPSVVYRRSAVERAGGYRDLPLMEDYWLFARMLHSGARVGNVADPLVLYRIGAGAYERRGGLRLLRSELVLQWHLRRSGFTTTTQFLRNVVVRGGYRLVPVALRQAAYRRMIR